MTATVPVLTGHDDDDWRSGALCAQTGGDLFFPDKGGSSRDAKRVCQECEVRSACLAWALANNIQYGIWGGLSDRERRKLRGVA